MVIFSLGTATDQKEILKFTGYGVAVRVFNRKMHSAIVELP